MIDRHTFRNARTLTTVRLLYPGDSHRLVAASGEAGMMMQDRPARHIGGRISKVTTYA